mmetsp:Transcript_16915/g.41931  ORF Transcript_16915/g.41931 Transcript_16915/m.41931 type:complete len:128 (-) Transcript_16915:227-610(-)
MDMRRESWIVREQGKQQKSTEVPRKTAARKREAKEGAVIDQRLGSSMCSIGAISSINVEEIATPDVVERGKLSSQAKPSGKQQKSTEVPRKTAARKREAQEGAVIDQRLGVGGTARLQGGQKVMACL